MTLEELKKHVRPLKWVEFGESLARPIDHIAHLDFIEMSEDGTWFSNYDRESYPTKEEAMQSVEEYHLRELAKFFELEDED